MARDASFDIVSEVDLQEVDNAINQAKKEISQRYDFKNSKVEINVDDDQVKILAEDEYKLNAVIDVMQTKLINRKISIKNLDYGKIESASGGTVRQVIKIKQGIETEIAKQIVKDIKNSKIKVQAQIMNDQVRVTGKNRDDLQAVIQLLKNEDYNLDLQFTNYR
ncbi:YajQ family cyclic di-GMP-binding protein [Tepidibacillus marianensis]|uniref:YajQ family cyclic di-GMP-binding protein n=1 Tax=Tepidibacillus marianensis TaxID=3131995 RepID=UPI0030D2652E